MFIIINRFITFKNKIQPGHGWAIFKNRVTFEKGRQKIINFFLLSNYLLLKQNKCLGNYHAFVSAYVPFQLLKQLTDFHEM
jgi:hypothetical protein